MALEDRQRVLEVVAVAVVEGDEDGAGRKWSAVDVVIAHPIERHRRVAETVEEADLLREDRRRHGRRVRLKVVDLVVHENAERPLGLSVEPSGAGHRLSDRAIDAVLQELLRSVGPHRVSVGGLSGDVVHELADAAGVLLRRREPRLNSGVGGCAKALRERTIREHAYERVGESGRVPGLDEDARLPVFHDVRDPADAASDHAASAAERLDDDAPETLRTRREDENGGVVERPRDLRRRQRLRPSRLCREIGDEPLRHVAKRPATDEVEPRVRDARGGQAPGVSQDVDRLVPLEDADEQSDEALRVAETGSRSTNGSRSMNAANSAVGSTPAARTSPDVYAEIVRTPSLLRSPRRASASASGASALRNDDP